MEIPNEATLQSVLRGYRGGFEMELDGTIIGRFFDMFESQRAPDGDLSAEFNDSAWVSCPYCGEASELPVDLAGGSVQEYVEDCEVCCQPWLVRVELDGEGYASVAVTTLDDG